MHAIATFLFNSPAYKSVISHELILDKDGQKMSKSKGNVVDPFKVVADYGADAVRWYLIASSPPHKPKLFDESGLVEVQRKFFSTLLNTYAFFTLYANIDGFTYSEPRMPVSERSGDRPVDNFRDEHSRQGLFELHGCLRRYESGEISFRFHDRSAFKLVRSQKPPQILERGHGER